MREFDLAIVGAGIVGAAAAYLTGKARPDWRVLLLDRSFVGDGATRYSAALDLPFTRSLAQKALVEESVRFYQALKLENPELPLHEIGAAVAVPAAEVQRVKESFVDQLQPAGADELAQLENAYGTLTLPPDYVVLAGNNTRYARASEIAVSLVQYTCKHHNLECWEGTEVIDIRQENDNPQLICADGREVVARRVLAAVGPWMTNGPLADFSRGCAVRIKKVAALHVDVPAPRGTPVLYFAKEDAFLLPVHEEGRLILSFTSEEWDCPPEISRLRISARDRAIALSVLERYCPGLIRHCQGGRVFCDAYSKDRVPLIVPVPDRKNFVVAGACSGSGFRLAPGMARQALALLGITETGSEGNMFYEKSTCAGASPHAEW
jgi:glycine/D-amino acid oxidase-like deaminating enzyme